MTRPRKRKDRRFDMWVAADRAKILDGQTVLRSGTSNRKAHRKRGSDDREPGRPGT